MFSYCLCFYPGLKKKLSDFGYSFLSNTESKKFGWESKKRESLSVYCGILKVRAAAGSVVLREALMLL
jgi:hypothetical protein